MNKTYKVIFSKVRGALMVCNEITSSVQKKGVKLVLLSSGLLFTSFSIAANDISASSSELSITGTDTDVANPARITGLFEKTSAGEVTESQPKKAWFKTPTVVDKPLDSYNSFEKITLNNGRLRTSA